jgi:hypothetical protein
VEIGILMPTEPYVDQLEPPNTDADIWRFINGTKFRDLMATSELYFCRADLFDDQEEGLPPAGFYRDLNPLDLRDRRQLNNSIGSQAQFREAFFINCWHLFREETNNMWKKYGEDGVAICSTYALLKASLDALSDRAYIGAVRYGPHSMLRENVITFITTKHSRYAEEREIRAFLWIPDPHAGINRHIDADNQIYPRPLTPPPPSVPKGQRRNVDLRKLVTEIVVTPWATTETFEEIERVVRNSGHTMPVKPSALTRYRELLPGDGA